jgi:LmbE family N-acetylglucosaminyl deacetylase
LRALSARNRVCREAPLLGRSAVVFAPHPDDETLGCGGTILKKTGAGAEVTIVVMTDGGASHRDFMEPDRLREIREAEAVEASLRLGVPAASVHLLGFADRGLGEARPEAAERVADLLRAVRPGEIYVPYEHDTPADHRVTRAVVLEASRCLDEVVVYEYPVWFWFHWPWVAYPVNNRRDVPRITRDTTRSVARLLQHLSSAVYIGDVLEQKRNALDAYKSQMTRLVNDGRWARLEDVAGGEFLALFFEPYELFREYKGGTV